MPELPEVETIVSQLKNKILGKTVTRVEIFDKLVDSNIKSIVPFKIIDIYRRAKYIVVVLNQGNYLLAHLGLTGRFYFFDKVQLDRKNLVLPLYLVAKFYLNDGSLLTHNSSRKIGSFKLVNEKQLNEIILKLGPEPLADGFTFQRFSKLLLKKPNANIKVTLMDQPFISGIGNIYSQEALYYAGISPIRKINTLSSVEIKKLYTCLIDVLQKGIKCKGASVDDYLHLDGKGEFQNHLAVYQQDCCPKNHKLNKITLSGRGTKYCPLCQK